MADADSAGNCYLCILAGRTQTTGRLYIARQVIQEVLAEPCDMSVDYSHAVRLIKRMWSEVKPAASNYYKDISLLFANCEDVDDETIQLITSDLTEFNRHLVCNLGYAYLLGAGRGKPCGIIIVSLMAQAYRLYSDNTIRKFDGWGFYGGDRGSGGWIGQAALRAYLQYIDGCGPSSSIMFPKIKAKAGSNIVQLKRWLKQITPNDMYRMSYMVFEAAKANDQIANEIIMRAVRHLTALAQSLKLNKDEFLFLGGDLAGSLYEAMGRVYAQPISIPAGDAFDGLLQLASDKNPPARIINNADYA